MTVTIDLAAPVHPVAAPPGVPSRVLVRLMRSEVRKMTTTKTWWVFVVGSVAGTVVSLLFQMLQSAQNLNSIDPTWTAAKHSQAVAFAASDLFTSGQYLGALFAMVLAILLMTNEYQHQTLTLTFLATPRRSTVIYAKFAVGACAAGVFWLVSTAIDVIGGLWFFHSEGVPNHLGDPIVVRTIFASLLVFAMWALFGLGLGALLRNQVWATLTGSLLYTVGFALTWLVFTMVSEYVTHGERLVGLMVIVPTIAAQVGVSSSKIYPESPPQWVGLAIMVGYGVLMAIVGVAIIRKRDIS
jgi:ABC-type transport system involved in multi-copper enzyme maturation permease subunit